MKRVYLIGHGNLEIKEFVDLLIKNNIKTLVDVRSIPYSKYNSQFNRENLEYELSEVGIEYKHLGNKLGGKIPEDFEKYIKSEEFNEGLNVLKEIIISSNSAIMCAEIDYNKCHRKFIALRLNEAGFDVLAIGKKGIVQKVTQKTLTDIFQ
ncbi:MAG: hypothetical protein BWY36_00524 [Candidatus Diapherotrites archaeon ADurb.Bin253]|jgi:uncharacterized protein (DUF488 family)|nr:MAG: hypothetical protein BWY36_00524 [Candidatus Diapherotrites archaeon ADurb.Bin253]HNZ51865.1 DUF488 domain-containing protein [Candidatus Pacearchaeota archaeon]HOH04161.1 DUF488 domain-containing protein [Candidatus Pacearchaeota archaeon]HPX74929.1 DUF488 domain-containing protein [Candidatus Pacearchaeota archaeon]HQC61281.1 DUF488 domain-containing protein [Candidatus Pacearchaeota archaeon]